MTQKIGLSFGALSDPIATQLKRQGFKYSPEKVKLFQKELDAITTLRFGSSLLTDSMTEKLTQKLYKKIVSHVCQQK